MPKRIKAVFSITTPMFIGDADQAASTVRPASIKGALRFWWRALQWPTIRQNHNTDEEALKQLHQKEGVIWGAVDAKEQGQGKQANALIRVKMQRHVVSLPQKNPTMGIQYLLGFGIYKDGFTRSSAILKGSFELEITLKPCVSTKQAQQVVKAVQALGLLGGLGARSRKGCGSVALQLLDAPFLEPQQVLVPSNTTELKQFVQQCLPTSTIGLPPYTAFSSKSRIDISAIANKADVLHNMAGHEMQMFRSWGSNERVGSDKAERNFQDDHDNVRDVIQGIQPSAIPDRAIFGLPHNYFFSSAKPKTAVAVEPELTARPRRASPLLIHIHQFPNGQFALVQSLLPATFLPKGDIISFKPKGGMVMDVAFQDEQAKWSVIDRYLNRFKERESVIYD